MKPSEDPVHTGVPLSLSYNTFSSGINLASEMYAQNTSIETDSDVERRYVQQPDWLIVCRRNTLVESLPTACGMGMQTQDRLKVNIRSEHVTQDRLRACRKHLELTCEHKTG